MSGAGLIGEDDSALRAGLTAALGVRRWVDEVASAAPFADLAELRSVIQLSAEAVA